MQASRQRKPGTRLLRVFFKLLLTLTITLTSIAGALILWVQWGRVVQRWQWMNSKLRRLAKRANPVVCKIAGTRVGSLYFHLSVLKHVGRSSGRAYMTPLSAYPLGDGFVLPLPYGPDVDWYRNIMASGKCTLKQFGQEYPLEKPEIIPASEALSAFHSWWVRFLFKSSEIQQYVWVHQQRGGSEKDTPGIASLEQEVDEHQGIR